MSLFDVLFGSDNTKSEKSSSSTSSTTDATKQTASENVTGQSQQTQSEGKATQAGTQTNKSYNLSQPNIDILNSIISNAAGKSNVYGQGTADAVAKGSQLTDAALSNVAGADANTQHIIDAQVAAAKLAYNENEAPALAQFGDATGSSLNSTVQLLKQKGNTDLATKIAAITGDTSLQAQQLKNQGLAVASDITTKNTAANAGFEEGGSKALQDALAALTTGKGVESTEVLQSLQSGTTSQATTSEQITQELLRELTDLQEKTQQTSTSKGSSGGSSTPGAIPSLVSLLSLFANN